MKQWASLGRISLLLILVTALLKAETDAPSTPFASLLAEGKQLIQEEDFGAAEEVLHQALRQVPTNVEALFLMGLVLAKQEKWDASRKRLEQATTQDPDFLPAHLELAGVHFKLGNHSESIRILRKVLFLDPDHDYAHRFLGTLLYLEDQKIEALEQWNDAQEPRINRIRYQTAPETTAEFLQRLFPLNEGEILRRQQILDIQWKQTRFHLGPPFHWHLEPSAGDTWDLEIALPPPSTFSFPKAFLLENVTRVLFNQEVGGTVPLGAGTGRTLSGSVRWDPPRKRLQTSAQFPFVFSSADALGLDFDLRDEEWDYTPTGTKFDFREKHFLVDYEYLMSDRKSLSIGGGYQHQFLRFEEVSRSLPYSPDLLRLGLQWNQLFSLNPADTAQLHWGVRLVGAYGLTGAKNRARQLLSTATFRWRFHRPSRARFSLSAHAGLSSSDLPLDDYFILGIGQDGPLPLRAHPTVQNGRKGNSPMGRNFALANLELHRRLVRWRIMEISGLLFSDTAVVSGGPFEFGLPAQLFYDVGAGFRLRVLGYDLAEVLFGFDLKTSSFNFWAGLPSP